MCQATRLQVKTTMPSSNYAVTNRKNNRYSNAKLTPRVNQDEMIDSILKPRLDQRKTSMSNLKQGKRHSV